MECPLDKYDYSLPYALSVDKGAHSDGLNYMVINYSHDDDDDDDDDDRADPGQTDGGAGSFPRQRSATAARQPRRGQWRHNVTRCFPAFQMGYDDHALLAEVVAVSRLLGVQHFVFYVQSAGPQVLAMLKVRTNIRPFLFVCFIA